MCFFFNETMDNRSRMSHEKCCGMPVEKTCYIFAIINVIIVCLWWLGCILAMGFLATTFLIAWIQNNVSQLMPTWMIFYLIYAVFCVLTAVTGVFSVLLLQGIRKKKHKLVMTYLLFGLIVEMVMIMATAIYTGTMVILVLNDSGKRRGPVYGTIALAIFICVFYGCILCLVRNTYLVLLLRSKTQNIIDNQTVLHVYEDYLRQPMITNLNL